MILGIYLLTALVLNINISDYIIKTYDWPLKLSSATIVYLGKYEFKDLNIGIIAPK